MMSLSDQVELYVRRTRILYAIYTKTRNRYYHILYPETRSMLNFVTKDIDLCIEAFPRSGNTYLVNMIKKMNPHLKLAHHKHSSGHVKEAIRLKIPTIILIRDPADAITSQLIWLSRNGATLSKYLLTINHYIQFYSYIKTVKDQVVILFFKSLTENTSTILEKINSIYHLWSEQIDYSRVVSDVLISMKNKQTTKNIYKSPFPSDIRNVRKREVKTELLNTYYDELKPAYSLYENLVEKTWDEKVPYTMLDDYVHNYVHVNTKN